jgi:hypothetical protein
MRFIAAFNILDEVRGNEIYSLSLPHFNLVLTISMSFIEYFVPPITSMTYLSKHVQHIV